MLSRIAESLFWIGRYVERADDTARILDVHLQTLTEDPWADEDTSCRSLMAIMGSPVPDGAGPVARADLLAALAYSTAPGAIVGSLHAARENARRARETVSTELWECLNTTRNELPAGRWAATSPHRFFAWVRERAAVVAGIADSTMSRDESWNFLVLGRSLERADMTARLLATRAVLGPSGPSWPVLLRSCGAHEAFVRTYRGMATDHRAAEFLLLDRLFPRSVVHALGRSESCLLELEPEGRSERRFAVSDDALRLVGRARTDLEYRPLSEVLKDLPAEMERVQRACAAASDAVSRRYFPHGPVTAWVEEIS